MKSVQLFHKLNGDHGHHEAGSIVELPDLVADHLLATYQARLTADAAPGSIVEPIASPIAPELVTSETPPPPATAEPATDPSKPKPKPKPARKVKPNREADGDPDDEWTADV